MKKYFITFTLVAFVFACGDAATAGGKGGFSLPRPYKEKNAQLWTAAFAGGCFWCMEPPFVAMKPPCASLCRGRKRRQGSGSGSQILHRVKGCLSERRSLAPHEMGLLFISLGRLYRVRG